MLKIKISYPCFRCTNWQYFPHFHYYYFFNDGEANWTQSTLIRTNRRIRKDNENPAVEEIIKRKQRKTILSTNTFPSFCGGKTKAAK